MAGRTSTRQNSYTINGEAVAFDFYRFADGEDWYLGRATLNLEGDTYVGQFDTKDIMFDNREDLKRILCKRGIDKDSICFAPIQTIKVVEGGKSW